VRRWLWWIAWALGIVAAIGIGLVVVGALSRSGVTDAERACALVKRPIAKVFGPSSRLETDEGDCVVDLNGRAVVVHIYGNPVGEGHFRASRRAVAETDRSVADAPVRGGEAFFADRRTTLWAYDPKARIEFALFTSGGPRNRLIELANAVLARSG
jgi:hypothetical protein